MSKITAAAILTRDALPDAPEEQYIDTMLENTSSFQDQTRSILQNGFSVNDNTPWKRVPYVLKHGIETEIKSPFDDPAMPITDIFVSRTVGLSVDSTGRPDGGTYSLAQPTLSWRPSGKPSGSIYVTVQYAPPQPITVRGFLPFTSPVTIPTGGATVVDVTSIPLAPGDWMVSAVASFIAAAITGARLTASVTTASATNGTIGDNRVDTPTVPTTNATQSLVIPDYRITTSTAVTAYLTANSNHSAGTLTVGGRISAVCIAPDPATTGRVTLFFVGP